MKCIQLQKGDIIVDFGRIYQITDIKQRQNADGESDEYIFYKTCIKSQRNGDIACSMPVKNIAKTYKRLLASNDDIDKTLEILSCKEALEYDKNEVEEIFNRNNLEDIAKVIRDFENRKLSKDSDFTATDRDTLEKGLNHLCLELATVRKIDLSDAKKIVRDCLKKQIA